ncbi:MAG: carbohydrate-binding family 9-like protein, partial [Actinomycetota bacterium]
ASPVVSLRDEARRLADSVRDVSRETVRAMREAVSSVAAPAVPAPPTPPAAVTPCVEPTAAPGGVGSFQGISPIVGADAYLAPGCHIIGDVVVGEEASIWAGAVLRGDVAAVRLGARSNVQEGAVLHVSPQLPCVVGSGVTIGHQATVHACTIGNNTLIGIQAVVLDGAVVGEHCIIAAGAVVAPGARIPDGKMVMGVPAKVVRDLTPQEIERVRWNADSYVSLKGQYQRPTAAPAAPLAPMPVAKPEPPAPGSLPRYECRQAAGAIVVDGSLDDDGWAGVAALSPLVHANGEGQPINATEVRACWDAANLYVSFACKDSDIWANYEHRDDPLYDEEVVELFLCPKGDLRHYFEMEVSPANVIFDAKVFNPEGDRATMLVDREWNAPGLRTAVRVSGTLNDRTSPDIGWIAEVAVPFADLGLSGPPAPGTVWRANFYRIERGAQTEFTAWSPTYKDPADFHVPACFGELVFVAQEEV